MFVFCYGVFNVSTHDFVTQESVGVPHSSEVFHGDIFYYHSYGY